MKKEVLCMSCAVLHPVVARHWFGWHVFEKRRERGERFVVGRSRYEIDCEACRKAILKGQEAAAVTSETEDRDYEWESEFLEQAGQAR